MMMKQVGPYTVMGDGVSPVEIKVPNFEQPLLPVISTLQSMFASRTSTFTSGISNQMLTSAPPAAQVMREVADFTRGCALVAHNAAFDRGFWRHEMALAGIANGNLRFFA